jgi:hypothetical protein
MGLSHSEVYGEWLVMDVVNLYRIWKDFLWFLNVCSFGEFKCSHIDFNYYREG